MHSVFDIPLEMVPPGAWADVIDVYGDSAWVLRMAELGIRAGSRLRMLNAGQPCMVEVGSTRLSVRNDSDSQILVRTVA